MGWPWLSQSVDQAMLLGRSFDERLGTKGLIELITLRAMNLNAYFNTLTLLIESEEQLNLVDLTESDRRILLALWVMSNGGSDEVRVNYKKCASLIQGRDVSKAQFYQTIRKAIEMKLIYRVGSSRAGRYKFVSELIV